MFPVRNCNLPHIQFQFQLPTSGRRNQGGSILSFQLSPQWSKFQIIPVPFFPGKKTVRWGFRPSPILCQANLAPSLFISTADSRRAGIPEPWRLPRKSTLWDFSGNPKVFLQCCTRRWRSQAPLVTHVGPKCSLIQVQMCSGICFQGIPSAPVKIMPAQISSPPGKNPHFSTRDSIRRWECKSHLD